MNVTVSTLLSDLEKSAFAGDPTARMVLEHPITNILIKELVEKPYPSYMHLDVRFNQDGLFKDGKRRLIAGYASVEVIDKQNELITIPALQNALTKMITAGEKYANVNLEHSNITLGKILLGEHVKDSKGVDHFTHVDDRGLYVVCELRDDLEIANRVWEMANKGELNAFSIGGRCLKRKPGSSHGPTGPFWQIDDIELYEVTICKRGKNTLSGFDVLKSYKDWGLIDEATFLMKSAELSKSEQIVKQLSIMPNIIGKTFILRENFVCQVDDLAKADDHTVDLAIKMDQDNPLRRHIQTQFSKAVPSECWPDLGYTFGAGDNPASKPLFHLALIPVESTGVAKCDCEVVTDPKQALRIAIKAEYGAISLYEKMAANVTDEETKQVLLSVSTEEKTHVGEFQERLVKLDPEAAQELSAGAEENKAEPATQAAVDGAITLVDQKTEGHKSKPKEYEHVPDDQFADPVNFKYPLDKEHVSAAWNYLHVDANREAGGYSESEWNQMKEKTKAAMLKFGHQVSEEKASTEQSSATLQDNVDRTLKNIVNPNATIEDSKLSQTVSKAVGGEQGLVGTGTGPNEGGKTGTNVTGVAIASRKTKVAKMEEAMKAAGLPIPPEDEEDNKDPAGQKPDALVYNKTAEEKAKCPEPDADDKDKAVFPPEKQPAAACKEPDADDKDKSVDETTLKSLLAMDAAGKLPAEMSKSVKKMAEKANISKADLRMDKLEKMIEGLSALVNQSVTLQKSASGQHVPTAAEVAAELKNQTGTMRKSANAPGMGPEETPSTAAPGAAAPLTLTAMHNMTFGQVHELNERRNQMNRGAN
jgi:rubrerythrin